jgi:DNA polymerase-4/protein ImuB
MVIAFLKRKLESTFLPGPLEDLRLQVEGFTGSKGKQKSLFLDLRRKEQIGEAVQQLETQFNGKTLVYRYQEVEPFSRIPERRGALIPFVH